MSQPPNILLVMVDQMTSGAVGAMGHPAALTPNLDRLVSQGIAFRNAYTNSPICVPARAAFMTGLLPRRCGVFDNGSELPAALPTVAHHLARAGYRTILAGKMHFVGPDQLHGLSERLTGDISLPGFTLTPDWSRGAYPNEGSSVARLREPQVVERTLQLDFDEEVLSASLARLRRLGEEGERFFMCASFSHPHDPFRITEEYWQRYQGVAIPPPAVPARPLEQMHPFDRWIQIHHEVDRHRLDERTVEANRRAYLAMVSQVDDHVGKLLAELERSGLAENTAVLFTSDHGEMLGEHGMWFKRTYFDAASKVPLIVRLPGGGGEGRIRNEVVSLIDLSATLLDLAEVPDRERWIAEMDGDSFVRLLGDGGSAPLRGDEESAPSFDERRSPPLGAAGKADEGGSAWKDRAVCEYYAEGAVRPMLFLRRGRWKYVHVHGHRPLLFDLVADPHEVEDLAGRPELQELRRELASELLDGLDVDALEERILRSQRERLAILETAPERFTWAYRPDR